MRKIFLRVLLGWKNYFSHDHGRKIIFLCKEKYFSGRCFIEENYFSTAKVHEKIFFPIFLQKVKIVFQRSSFQAPSSFVCLGFFTLRCTNRLKVWTSDHCTLHIAHCTRSRLHAKLTVLHHTNVATRHHHSAC